MTLKMMTGCGLAAALCLSTQPAQAQAGQAQNASADAKVDALIALLVDRGIITQEKAQALKTAVNTPAATAPPAPAAPKPPASPLAAVENQSAIRQPEAPRTPPPGRASNGFPNNRDPSVDPSAPVVRNAGFAAQDQSWTDRIRLDGDIRLRWQGEYLDKESGSAKIPNWAGMSTSATSLPVTNYLPTDDRARLRYRARLGFTARVDDHFTAVIRLAAGNLTEPTSTDQTLGNFFNRNGVGIDRAYLQWQPTKAISIAGGKMANPFFTTNLLWDGDVNPEGVAASYRLALKSGYLFATGGAFYVQENAGSSPDRFLYAGQIGVAGLPLGHNTHLKLAATYYDWSHYQGQVGDLGTASTVLGQGNTVMDIDPRTATVLPGIASPFRIIEILGAVSQRIGHRYAVSGAFDYAVNVAYDLNALRALPLLSEPNGNQAWLAAITMGDANVSERGQWQFTLSHRMLQSDSVIAAFTEGDFNPGGTNRRVDALEGLIGMDHNAWLQLSYFRNHFLTGPHYQYDAIRVQFNVRF
jgi:hypothetical protein